MAARKTKKRTATRKRGPRLGPKPRPSRSASRSENERAQPPHRPDPAPGRHKVPRARFVCYRPQPARSATPKQALMVICAPGTIADEFTFDAERKVGSKPAWQAGANR